MIKISKIVLQLSILLHLNTGIAQFTSLYTPDRLIAAHSPKKLAHYGNKVLLQISKDDPYIIQTDGTKEGTKILDIDPYSGQFFQVSKDTCLWVTTENNKTKVQLFTTNQNEPILYTINNFFFDVAKVHNNKLILHQDMVFLVLDISNGSYIKKQIPEISLNNNWILWQNELLVASFIENIYKISLEDLSITSTIPTGIFQEKRLIPYNDSLFLYTIYEGLFVSNSTSSRLLKALNSANSFPSTTLSINNSVYFSYISNNFQVNIVRTNGTPEGTSFAHTPVSPFLNSVDIFKLNNKLYFYIDEKLWISDGTQENTKIALNYRAYKPYNSVNESHGKFFFLAQDWTKIWRPFIFDGNNLSQIQSSNQDKANYPLNINSYEFIGKNHLYLPLVDINYGQELHRFNYETKEVEMIYDFTPGPAWSNVQPITEINHHLIFTATINKKTYFMSFDESQIITEPNPPKKNFDWQENIRALRSIQKTKGVTDSKGNFYISIQKAVQKEPVDLVYNRKTLDTLQANKIIKLSNKGKYLSSIELAYSTNKPVAIATNRLDELITAMIIKNNIVINGQIYKKENGNLLLLTWGPNEQIKWSKQFNIGLKGVVDNIATKGDQIFLTGKYSGKIALFDQHTIQSERNIATFLTKLSLDGNVQWANAYPLSEAWPIDKGISPIAIGQDEVYILQRLGNTQRIDKCTKTKHRFKLHSTNQSTGKKNWQKEFISKDFSFPIDLDVSPNGQISIIGSYMDEIQFDDITLPSDSCNQTNFFRLDVNRNGQIIKAERQDLDYQFLTQIMYDTESNLYVMGTQVDSSYFGTVNAFDTINYNDRSFSHKVLTIFQYNPVGVLNRTTRIHQNTGLLDLYQKYLDLEPQICFSTQNNIILSCTPFVAMDTFNVLYGVGFYPFKDVFLLQYKMDNAQTQTLDGDINPDDIFLYPNPVHHNLNIKSTDIDFTQASIIIYAIDGKQWDLPRNKNHGYVKINTSTLPQGVYVVAIRFGDKVLARKFVKTKP